MRSFLRTAVLLSLVPGSLGKLAALPNPNLPFPFTPETSYGYPFTPPSDDFCKSNTLDQHLLGSTSVLSGFPDDTYHSFYKACEFTFFKASYKPEHFSCDSYEESMAFMIQFRRVGFWPESCVAVGRRCYDLKDYPELSNLTYNDAYVVGIPFPPGATVVSVDCTADYTEAKLFIKNPGFFRQYPFIGIVLFVPVLACICCSSIWCCFCFFGARRLHRGNYRPIHVQHGLLLRPEAIANHDMHQD